MKENWNNELEREFKVTIKEYFNKKILEYLEKSDDYIEVAIRLQ